MAGLILIERNEREKEEEREEEREVGGKKEKGRKETAEEWAFQFY